MQALNSQIIVLSAVNIGGLGGYAGLWGGPIKSQSLMTGSFL